MAITWKVAAASGASIGLGIGGFALNSSADDGSFQPVRDVDLQSARDSISSLSSPIKVSPPTTAKDASASPLAPAPPAASDSAQSAASPTPAPAPTPTPSPAPAPAPAYDDSASADAPVQPSTGGGGDSASFSGGGNST